MFDKIAIREKVEYVSDKYYGFVNFGDAANNVCAIANKALVFMLVAVNESWKEPVAYFFIDSVKSEQKAELLKQVYAAITTCSILVCNVTFAGCTTNFAVCNLFAADMINIKTCHTKLNFLGETFALPDPSHMVKFVRNCFGERKITIDGNGGVINFRYLEMLVILQEEEGLHLANKIRRMHINFFKQKMKVKLATQLLSQSVADALMFCENNLQIAEFENVSATVKFMNNAFNILNSHKLSDWEYKKALYEQNVSQ